MRPTHCALKPQFEAILAQNVRSLACEIRGYDVLDLVAFARLRRMKTLAILIESELEHLYKPNTMVFGREAEAIVDWGRPPEMALLMQFRNAGVEICFQLLISNASAGVDIDLVRFPPAIGEASRKLACFSEALSDAHAPSWRPRIELGRSTEKEGSRDIRSAFPGTLNPTRMSSTGTDV